MKKLGLIVLGMMILGSCQQEPKDYVTIKGVFDNNSDTLLMITGFSTKKMIQIDSLGRFEDSLKVAKPDFYSFATSTGKRGFIYLKNGYDLTLRGDSDEFFRSFVYAGDDEGADSNNFIISRYNLASESGNVDQLMLLEKQAMLDTLSYLKAGMDTIAQQYRNTNKKMLEESNQQNNSFFSSVEKNYDRMHEGMVKKYEALSKLEKGKPAPKFTDYEDFKGGKKSLEDFRGSYVYIDVWATWCGPCIVQFPFLKQLEEEYKGKNISFVSISTDNDQRSGGSWDAAREKWKGMVKKYDLEGVQLWAGKDELRFSQEYVIEIIPRFIIVDPKGNIVDSQAPRPFDPALKKIFAELGL